MKRFWPGLCVVFVGVAFSGCGLLQRPNQQQVAEDSLGEQVDFSLADLLEVPRAELAAKSGDLEERVRAQLEGRAQGKQDLILLQDERISLDVPVFNQARYSEQLKFSVPPYVNEAEADDDLALHLARYGDVEAARRLAGSAGSATLSRIEELALAKNYPVEWTRLVGLMQIEARNRLAANDPDGAVQLIQIHRQLGEVLDEKAAKGPLGAALLGSGRKTMAAAVRVWRASKQTGKADRAEAALKDWGDVPSWSMPRFLDNTPTGLAGMLHGKQKNHVVAPDVPARALDLLALPVCREGIENVFLCTDDAGHLGEVVVVYQPRTSERYHSLSNLTVHLQEQGLTTKPSGERWLRHETCKVDAFDVDFLLPLKGTYLGAMVRFRSTDAHIRAELPRDFGAVHLDRSFEMDRWLLAPRAFSEPVRTESAPSLARLFNPLPNWPILTAQLTRDGHLDVAASLTLWYDMDRSKPPSFSRLMEACWGAWGTAQVSEESGQIEQMKLVWQDGETRYTLRIPIGLGPITEFVAEGRTSADMAQRARQVADWDSKERQQRLADNRPIVRLPRQLEFKEIELGTKRSRAVGVFERAAHFQVMEQPGLVIATFDGEPDATTPFVARQFFLRTDADDRVVEMRVRYQDKPGGVATCKWSKSLLNAWKAKSGAPVEEPACWASVWSDFPARKPAPACYRWLDDKTSMTLQVDSMGVEMAIRDCPPDQPPGAPLPPLQYLPRGPEGYSLGSNRSEAAPRAPASESGSHEEVLSVDLPATETYDRVQLTFDGNHKLVRIVARHTGKDASTQPPDKLTDQLSAVWAKQIAQLGWTRRQDFSAKQYLENMGWQDECTRFRIYWEQAEGQLRMYSEWTELKSK